MDNKIKEVIESIQCAGCIKGDFETCFKPAAAEFGVGCGAHHAGTISLNFGKFFIGLPKGFCRLGQNEKFQPHIYLRYEDNYDKFNVPVWKHRTKEGLILVRGLQPRINQPFLDVFIEDCFDIINCLEITDEDIDLMD